MIISGLLVLVILLMIGFYWYITTEWKKYYTKDEIKSFVNEIERAPTFSDTFYGVYDKLYTNDRHKSITSIYSAAFWNEEIIRTRHTHQISWFVRAACFFPKKQGMRGHSDFKLAWGLEKFTTPEKCFDFVMNIENEQMMRLDSSFKELNQISDTTAILEYLVKTSAPSRYRRNPEKLNQRVAALRAKLNE